MNKTLKMAAVTVIAILGIIIIYRVLFIRTVHYNIGGMDIPAKYNILTGKADPVLDLNKAAEKNPMDANDVTAAHFRWALFEGWVKSRPQYKGWESNPEIFKKANEEFKNTVQANVKVLK